MNTTDTLRALLDEVRGNFTRDDDLPDDLLPRIDAAIALSFIETSGGQAPSEMAEPVAWFAFGDSNGPVPLELYGWDEKACKNAVLSQARACNYKGTVEGYLIQQGWTLRPVYLAAPQPAAIDDAGEPWRIGEFVRSSDRRKTVKMVAQGTATIAEYGAHKDFVRWLAMSPATPQLVERKAPSVIDKGVPREGCNYLAHGGQVCDKCGEIHLTPAQTVMPLDGLAAWLRCMASTNNDRDSQTLRAWAKEVEAARRDTEAQVGAFAIEVEKLLCAKLGREWAASVTSLIDQLAECKAPTVSDNGAVVPLEGWKLVPIEPTPEMIKAIFDAYEREPHSIAARIIAAHKAMLRAVPVPFQEQRPAPAADPTSKPVQATGDSVRGGYPVLDERASYPASFVRNAIDDALARQAVDMEVLAYALQGERANRLTPRIIDIAYTAFVKGMADDTDWFNVTKPAVESAIERLRRDLFAQVDDSAVEHYTNDTSTKGT